MHTESFLCLIRLLCVLCLDVNLADRALEQANLGAVVAGLDQNGFISDADDLTDDAADGGDLIAYGKVVAHVVDLFFLLLLGTDHKEIEEQTKAYQHHDSDDQRAGVALTAAEQGSNIQKVHVFILHWVIFHIYRYYSLKMQESQV